MRPPLQWTIDPIHLGDGSDERYATYYADFGRGRYSVARVPCSALAPQPSRLRSG
jgi:hypothetical protein